MTRIIGGHAGSLSLRTPGPKTRPTSDRVREAWFSKLDASDALEGARALDLYAGSGALGLEAASRGAALVTMVEDYPGAITAITANIAAIGAALPHSPALTVAKAQVSSFLRGTPTLSYDLVFIDPPYELASELVDQVLSDLRPWLAPGAWVMIERSTRSTAPQWPEGLTPLDVKKYGETALYFAEAP
jgi:16S rRNA (guanine966-N2)-methyltransferase